MRARPREERAPLIAAFMRQVLPRFGGPRSPRRSMARPDRASRPAEPEPPKRPEPDEGMVPLHPVVHQVFPFAEIARAHAAMEQNEPVGKIVLTW
jgi:hypothetical protein